jgi:hypothetical protein
MPLSPAASRRHLHTRRITCEGFLREDGLWDIEAHMSDVKTYAFSTEYRGTLEPGTPLHDMWIRLTVDESLTVKAIEAVTDGSPYAICPAITPRFQKLVGVTIGKGWRRAVAEHLSGVEGCTHLVELLQPAATVAFQTVIPYRNRRLAEDGSLRQTPGPAVPQQRPAVIDTCHALAADGPVVARFWPQFAARRGPGEPAG